MQKTYTAVAKGAGDPLRHPSTLSPTPGRSDHTSVNPDGRLPNLCSRSPRAGDSECLRSAQSSLSQHLLQSVLPLTLLTRGVERLLLFFLKYLGIRSPSALCSSLPSLIIKNLSLFNLLHKSFFLSLYSFLSLCFWCPKQWQSKSATSLADSSVSPSHLVSQGHATLRARCFEERYPIDFSHSYSDLCLSFTHTAPQPQGSNASCVQAA